MSPWLEMKLVKFLLPFFLITKSAIGNDILAKAEADFSAAESPVFKRAVESLSRSNNDRLPNIVFILADDQSTLLDSEEHMPKLSRLIADEGVRVDPMFVTTPVCCPSRSAIYSGKYIHNIGVHNNSAGSGGCSSLAWQIGPERHSIAFFMQQLGYATSFAGKYMNNYGYGTNSTVDSLPQCLNSTMAWDTNHMRATCAQRVEHVPRGWQNWQALKGNSVYYNYTLSNNGVAETHGDNYEDDYLIDLVKNRTLDFLGSAIAAKKPFFATLAVPSAHEPADPAPQYADYAKDLVAPRTPNFNLVMGANGPRGDDARHWMVANVNGASGGIPMNDTVISFVDLLYRRRLATLQSVDDLVEALVNKVDAAGKLDETYFVYTADNGYHLGQFAIGLDKRQPYDTDVKVPFYARGPGIPKRSQITYGALISIDLAPTFLQWAQVDLETIAALGFDGQPMAKYIASGSSTARRDFLIEYNGENWDACATYLANDFPGVNWDKLDDGLNCGLRGPDSFLTEPFWKGGETWSSIQDSSNNTYNCVRSVAGGGAVGEAGEIAATAKSGNSTDEIYCEWASGEVEYYDLIADPWQMANLAPSMDSALQREYQAKLAGLVGCVGSAECSGSGIKKE